MQPSPAPFVLAVDIGTSAVRAALYDAQGNALEGVESRVKFSLEIDHDGAFETDPDALLQHTLQAIDQALERAQLRVEHIAAVCGCTFVSNILGINGEGEAITPLILYADTRAAADAQDLSARLDEAACHQRTGTRFHSSYFPARLLWWRRTRPEEYRRVTRWISFHEYLLLQLFGDAAVSYSTASWTGLLNRQQMDWDAPLLAEIGIGPEQLSRLVDTDFSWRGLRQEYATRWPALAEIPWFPAIGDGAAANIGSGCAAPDRLAISMGTSSAARVVLPAGSFPIPAGLWCYTVDRRRALLGGAMTEGGSVFKWLRELFNLKGGKDLETALAALPPTAHGLTVLPLISGERSPGWISDARGMIMGLNLATTPLEIMRAGLEGVACRVALVYRQLCATLPAVPQVIGSGGAMQHSAVMQQILADALNCPLYVSTVAETSTRGAALLALEALGQIEDLSALPASARLAAEPNPNASARYEDMMARQRKMYALLMD